MMERFLARVAESEYRDHFILKGGMLVSAIVGEEARSTMDIDTTVRALSLTKDDIKAVVEDVLDIDLMDNLRFEIVGTKEIMEEHDYAGIRITLKAYLENLRETITIDVSAGDAITPSAVQFTYPMMFGQDSISVWSYNLETLLAEKIETVLSRSTANTRMRDFYDIYILWNSEGDRVDGNILREAFYATTRTRQSEWVLEESEQIIYDIGNSGHMQSMWNNYKGSNSYVGDVEWEDVFETVRHVVLEEIPFTQDITLSLM